MITKLHKEFRENIAIKLYWSTVLKQHYVVAEDGVRLEDGTWINHDRFLKDCVPMAKISEEHLKFYIAGLSVIRDRGYGLYD